MGLWGGFEAIFYLIVIVAVATPTVVIITVATVVFTLVVLVVAAIYGTYQHTSLVRDSCEPPRVEVWGTKGPVCLGCCYGT